MDYQLSQEAASAPVADGAVLSSSSQTVLHSSTRFSSKTSNIKYLFLF
jgi:hypothetical protein